MAEYLPPINNYAIFDSVSFMTSDLPISHEQATALLCKYPTAQGAMTFTGSCSFNGTCSFFGPLIGTSNSTLGMNGPAFISPLTNNGVITSPTINFTNNATGSVVLPIDSGRLFYNGTNPVTININTPPLIDGVGLTHTGTSGFLQAGATSVYNNITNTPGTYNNYLIGSNIACNNLTKVDGSSESNNIDIVLQSDTTPAYPGGDPAFTPGVLRVNDSFNSPQNIQVPNAYISPTLLNGKYPVLYCSGRFLWNSATSTISTSFLFNCTAVYSAVTSRTTVTFTTSLTFNTYIVLYNTSNAAFGLQLAVTKTYQKNNDSFVMVTQAGASGLMPTSNVLISWTMYL
jgi:hypothetical protein